MWTGVVWRLPASVSPDMKAGVEALLGLDESSLREAPALIRDRRNHLVFRLRWERGSAIVKVFLYGSLRERLKYRSGALSETRNVLLAAKLGVPVPEVMGYIHRRRWGLVTRAAVVFQDLAGYSRLSELAERMEPGGAGLRSVVFRAVPLLLRLYRAAVNHIDVSAGNIMLHSSDPSQDRIIDFHRVRFLDAPSREVLINQALWFYRSVGTHVSAFEDEWFEALMRGAGIPSSPALWERWRVGRASKERPSRKERLSWG